MGGFFVHVLDVLDVLDHRFHRSWRVGGVSPDFFSIPVKKGMVIPILGRGIRYHYASHLQKLGCIYIYMTLTTLVIYIYISRR